MLGLALIGISACARDVPVVNFESILDNPTAYAGRKIQIEGAAVVQFERNFVCANPEAIDKWNGPQCIWLSANYDVEGLDHLNLERYDKKLVRVVGVFSTERRGHLNQYVGEIVPTEVVVTGVHSAGRTKLE